MPGPGFLSDTSAGLCPEAVEALVAARSGSAVAYGDDPDTEEASTRVQGEVGSAAVVGFVATGTAANTLALASLAPPWGRLLCEASAHLASAESTAPERLTGCRVQGIDAGGRKLTPDDVRRVGETPTHGVHSPAPGVLTISNPTEFGEVYRPDEVARLAETAHDLGYAFHVDGARFANAVAAIGCPPRDLAADAGLDALSLGGTKNGLAMGEAVVVFPTERGRAAADRFGHLRKSFGHLISKQRYLSAPFAAALRDGAWLEHAAHANRMAARLAEGLVAAGRTPHFPVEANAVFVDLGAEGRAELAARGWQAHGFAHGTSTLTRLMTSFATDPAEVDALLADLPVGAATGA